MSLVEISSMDATAEPLWKELDRQRENYIAINGDVY